MAGRKVSAPGAYCISHVALAAKIGRSNLVLLTTKRLLPVTLAGGQQVFDDAAFHRAAMVGALTKNAGLPLLSSAAITKALSSTFLFSDEIVMNFEEFDEADRVLNGDVLLEIYDMEFVYRLVAGVTVSGDIIYGQGIELGRLNVPQKRGGEIQFERIADAFGDDEDWTDEQIRDLQIKYRPWRTAKHATGMIRINLSMAVRKACREMEIIMAES